MPMVEYMNTNVYYLNSGYNELYCGKAVAGKPIWTQNTGWSFIPNCRYDNWLTLKQMFDLITNHDKFIIHSCDVTVQNMIPLTDSLSIAQDTTFMSFNNTVYAVGYQDNKYETFMREWGQAWELLWREGISYKQEATGAASDQKMILPSYIHYLPQVQFAGTPPTFRPYTCYAWDPFCNPDSIMELRPGKNAISFSWERNQADGNNWNSTARYLANTNVSDNLNQPDVWANYANLSSEVITPPLNAKNDPRNPNYNKTMALHYKHYWNHPIPNMLMKLMPIMGTNNSELKQQAMVVIVKKIRFEVTPRVGCTNYPQVMGSFENPAGQWAGEYKAGMMAMGWHQAIGPLNQRGVFPYRDIDQLPYAAPNMEAKTTVNIDDGVKEAIKRSRSGETIHVGATTTVGPKEYKKIVKPEAMPKE